MIAPDFRDNARQRAGDDPADARGIGIQRSRRARLARHQILKIEHTDTGQDPDVNRVQRLHRQQQGRGMDSQHTDIKQQSGKRGNAHQQALSKTLRVITGNQHGGDFQPGGCPHHQPGQFLRQMQFINDKQRHINDIEAVGAPH